MNKDTPIYPAHGDEALEARIVAWVLGEASPFEATELERLCAEQPELEIFRRRIHTIHHLLDESEKSTADPAWQLAPEKRAALDEAFGTPAAAAEEAPIKKPRRAPRLWLSAAACVLLLAALAGLLAPMVTNQGRHVSEIPTILSFNATLDADAPEREMKRLQTEFPPELIEGTPVPITEESLRASRRQQPSPPPAPSSSQAEVIASRGVSPSAIPVPETLATLPEPSATFGDSDAFGQGFAQAAEPTPAQRGRRSSDTPLRQAEPGYRYESNIVSRSNLAAAGESQPADGVDFDRNANYESAYALGQNTAPNPLLTELGSVRGLAVPTEEQTLRESAIVAGFPSDKSDSSDLSDSSLTPSDAQALRELAETVEERRKTLASIVRTKGVTYTGDDSFYRYSASELGARTALSTFHQLEQEKVQLESQLESLIRYDDEQLLTYAAGLNLPDNTLRELYPKYLELKLQSDKLKSEGIDETSSQAAEVQEKLKNLRTQMDEGVVSLRATLRAQHNLATDRLARVETMRDGARDQAIQRGLDAQDYHEARAAYERDLRRLEEMQARLREESQKPRPAPPVPENETSAATDPFSTFSLNVSDAAFILARDALRRGERPAPEQIRIEQFYNALDYGDPAPASGEAVAANVEQAAHPVLPGRNLVRIAARTGSSGRVASQALQLTLLVDQSGSMIRADRRAAMDNTFAALTELLGENDRVNVIGFARQARIIAEGLPGNRAAELPQLVHQAAAEGGTNLEAALDLGEQLAARHHQPGAQNRIVILSDGAVNLGDADPDRLAERIKQMRQQGIATDIAGIGSDGLNDALLAELARHGDGRYHVVSPESGGRLAQDLAGAFRPAAEDVKVQVVFNPERVRGWKLIGFEEHRLRAEDFRNDAIDAAEMAADEAGVAIYQIEPLPDGRGQLGELFVRFRNPADGSIIERSWPLPYEANAPAFDTARPSMQLATLAMLVAEKLRGGPMANAIDLREHQDVIHTLRTHYQNDARANELFEMISAILGR